MKQIILEGPDLAGKSTISKLLTEITGTSIHHFGGPLESTQELFKKINKAPLGVVYDRHPCISEQVYCFLRGRSMIDVDVADQFLKRMDPHILYCDPGYNYLKLKMEFLKSKPHKEKKHVNSVRKHYLEIYQRYEDIMLKFREMGIQVSKIDFTTITKNEMEILLDEH